MTHASSHSDGGQRHRPRLLATVPEIRAEVAESRRLGRRLGVVPTMGALHEGHVSLVRASAQECDATIVTIFVNPTQFGPQEDFARYPRTMEADLDLLAGEGVTAVVAPRLESIFPPGCSTRVEPPEVAQLWEGVCRPGHFRGVATIVLKLFHLIPADVAFFGQKDFQQCRVIEQMVADLDLPIIIRRCPIVREPSALALSSRNRYLSPDDRQRATAIARCLALGRERIVAGEPSPDRVREAMRSVLVESGIHRIDYLAIADPITLRESDRVQVPCVLLVAAYAGETRLIDNCLITMGIEPAH